MLDANSLSAEKKRRLCLAALVSAANEGKGRMGYSSLESWIALRFDYKLNTGTIRYHVNLLRESKNPVILRRFENGKFEMVPAPKFLRDYRGVENLRLAEEIRSPDTGRFSKRAWIQQLREKRALNFDGVSRALQLFAECMALKLVTGSAEDTEGGNFHLHIDRVNKLAVIHDALIEHRVKRLNEIDRVFVDEANRFGFTA